MSERKRIAISDFRRLGYLQEVNRRFLHPLGLALEVIQGDDGEELGGVWDSREDLEGIAFEGLGAEEAAKAAYVTHQEEHRRMDRESALGYWVQPIP